MNATHTGLMRTAVLILSLASAWFVSTAAAAPTRTEYRGHDARNFFRMVLDVHQDPSTKVVIIDGGRIEFANLAQPYPIQQAGGNKVPKLGANQLAGVVIFSQANIGATATLFTGTLSGPIATGTISVQNVRFSAFGQTQDLSMTLTPVGVTAPSGGGGGSGGSGPLGSNVAGPGNGVGSPTGVNPKPVILPNMSGGGLLCDTTNSGGVTQMANPTRPTFFVTPGAHITEIWTYHWNNGRGEKPGTISLRSMSGITYGPWQAAGSAGADNAPNVNWTVYPNVNVPFGTYTIEDSSPSTWSENAESKHIAFAKVFGTRTPVSAYTPPPAPAPAPVVRSIPTRTVAPSPSSGPTNVLDNSNGGGVTQVGQPRRPSFTLNAPTKITEIWTYHWNGGRGAPPGLIGLAGSNGMSYGPWQATGSSGQGNAGNVNWTVYPNVTLPPGQYSVTDSSPSTWSENAQSGNAGFARVTGTR